MNLCSNSAPKRWSCKPTSKYNSTKSPFSSSLSFSLILANVRSICNKIDSLKLFVDQYKPDILAVTESLGRPSLLDSMITPSGYVLFRQDRCTRFGGGVFMLVKQSLSPSLYNASSLDSGPIFEDSVWCSFPVSGGKSVLVGCLYRSPSSTAENDALLSKLFDHISDAPFNFRVLVGDFMARIHKGCLASNSVLFSV